MEVIHTALRVSDLDATTEFYEDVLGLDHQWEFVLDGETNYYVGSGDGAEIQFKHDPDDDEPVEPAGFDHVALGVDDTDATFERVVAESDCGVELEPTTVEQAGCRIAFITDPDGYTVELVEELD